MEEEKVYKVKLTVPKCDCEDVFVIEEEFSSFDLVKKIGDLLAQDAGIVITWPKKGGGG